MSGFEAGGLPAGEREHVYTAERRGDRVFLRVNSGSVRYAKQPRQARYGPRLNAGESLDLEAARQGEELWLFAEEEADGEVEQQGWFASLFGPRQVDVDVAEATLPGEISVDIAAQALENVDIFNRTNYPNFNAIVTDTYPVEIDESWVIKELLVFDIPIDKTMDITSEAGVTVNDIEPKRTGFVLNTLQIDSFDVNDPDSSGGEFSAIWSGEP